MELDHFSHDHTLILSEELYTTDIICEACREPAGGLCYCCLECRYVLHKLCAELPQELQHDRHPQHPLKLFPKIPPNSSSNCKDCFQEISGFAFRCTDCSFNLHVECASLPKWFTLFLREKKESHTKLQTVGFELSFRKKKHYKRIPTCYICSQFILGSRYICRDQDNIFFHVQCATLPERLKYPRHLHFLNLAVNIRDFSDPDCEEILCDFCEQERDINCGAYCCESLSDCNPSGLVDDCFVVSHISCGLTGLDDRPTRYILQTSSLYVTKFDEFCPVLVGSTLDIEREHNTKQTRTVETGRSKIEGPQLSHFGHEDHHLVLYDEKMNATHKCEICATSIFGMTYLCNDCSFYLHKRCAELPQAIRILLHREHPLILTPKHIFNCKFCNHRENAFSYSCSRCNFELDVLCASIPQNYMCKGHEHPVSPIMFTRDSEGDSMKEIFIPQYVSRSTPCKACGYFCDGISLGCGQCHYYLHVLCALLPPNSKAETHRHNLSLCYSYEEDPEALEFICDICEKERIPGTWLYACQEPSCYLVAHIDCAVPNAMKHPWKCASKNLLESDQIDWEPRARIVSYMDH